MDVTYENLPDPRFFPLPPSIDEILTYADELEAEGHHITFEWADNEIRNHFLSYVRVGLVAGRVKLYKLYRYACPKVESFRSYCETCLGKSLWYVNRLIDAARVTLELAKAGFDVLPQCEAQARPLTKFQGDELVAKWQTVVDSIPSHQITAAAIAAIVEGELEAKNRQVRVDAEVWSELSEKAALAGISPAELLKKLVQEYQPDYPTPEAENEIESDATEALSSGNSDTVTPMTTQQLSNWLLDVQQLLIEHYGLAINSDFAVTSRNNNPVRACLSRFSEYSPTFVRDWSIEPLKT